MAVLLATVHGSRLYNLAHENSDYDWFEVHGWDKARGGQRIVGTEDRTKTSYDRFMRYCEKGVPQYLEAMFSQKAYIDNFPFDRQQFYVPGMREVRDTYKRTIKAFWARGKEENSNKMKVHAWRLHYNLCDMEESGRFNPSLRPIDISDIQRYVNHDLTPGF